MRLAIYGRVSTSHQVDHQTIEQQLERLSTHVRAHAAEGWMLDPAHVFRDDGLYVASGSAGDHIRWAARRAVSLDDGCGQRAWAVDTAPLLHAPLYRPDGIQGRTE